jgi:hypothetical protein
MADGNASMESIAVEAVELMRFLTEQDNLFREPL